jgi:hypothetical protein
MWGTAYVIGATANQNLFLAIHEISHNLAFRSPRMNRALAVVANLGIGVPYSASFRVSFAFLPWSWQMAKGMGERMRDGRVGGNASRLENETWRTEQLLTLYSTALPPNPPQIPRRRRPRHRPPHHPRSPIPRLPPRQSILLHLPNPLLRRTPNLHLQSALHLHPFPQHPRSGVV